MIKNIIDSHRRMLIDLMDITGMDEYTLSWFCFMKGVIFTSLIVWIF